MSYSAKYAGRIGKGMQGFAQLGRFAGGANSPMANFLLPIATRDVYCQKDDFDQGTINGDFWTGSAGTGATAMGIPATPIVGGAARGVTGTNATASNRQSNLYGISVLQGNKNCWIEFGFKISAVTGLHFEVGLLDTITTATGGAPAVTSVDTPSFGTGVGDAAIVAMDTGNTLTTMALLTLGSTPYAAAKNAIGTMIPTANTLMRVKIGIQSDTVYAGVNDGAGTALEVVKLLGIAGATLLKPWICVTGVNATSKNFDLDYVIFQQDR
jgi:hypothetical protein